MNVPSNTAALIAIGMYPGIGGGRRKFGGPVSLWMPLYVIAVSAIAVAAILFVAGLAYGDAPPPINKPQSWKVVEFKGFVDANDSSIWRPDLGPYLEWDNYECHWIKFATDEDYERFRKYNGLLVKVRCYEVVPRLRGEDVSDWNKTHIFIELQEIVK